MRRQRQREPHGRCQRDADPRRPPAPGARLGGIPAAERLPDERRRRDAKPGPELARKPGQRQQHVDDRRLGRAELGDHREDGHQRDLQQALLRADRPADGGDLGDARRSRAGAQEPGMKRNASATWTTSWPASRRPSPGLTLGRRATKRPTPRTKTKVSAICTGAEIAVTAIANAGRPDPIHAALIGRVAANEHRSMARRPGSRRRRPPRPHDRAG